MKNVFLKAIFKISGVTLLIASVAFVAIDGFIFTKISKSSISESLKSATDSLFPSQKEDAGFLDSIGNIVFDSDNNIQLVSEPKIADITIEEVFGHLDGINELLTVKYDYAGTARMPKEGKAMYFFDSYSELNLEFSGTVYAGYDVNELNLRVDNDNNIIYVTIPDRPELTNEYSTNTTSYSQQWGSEFVPEDALCLEEDCKAWGIQQAIDSGIYETAAENLKSVINDELSAFDGYEVQFLAESVETAA